MSNATRLRPREREAIIQSLRAGVTPRAGLQHIQVGRAKEVTALLKDIGNIVDGGATFRLVIGEYGAGKTFFLQLVRSIALEKGLVTMHADLAPDRRIHATQGQARNLYAELARNMATRTKPDGNALESIVERFITEVRKEADKTGEQVEAVVHQRLYGLSELVGGYDFAKVIASYWKGHDESNDQLKQDAVRWLRGEFTTKTDSRVALDVRSFIDDAAIYDHLKLVSLFVRQAGYKGLLVNLDEMVNLYKLSSSKARTSNYEQLLRMLNDSLQGSANHIGFLLGGTPDFLMDPRKGLYSYEALRSRLAENSFAQLAGITDYSSPSLHLTNLAPEELLVLLKNLRHVFASGDSAKYLVSDDGLMAFLQHCSTKIGDAYFRTPRNTIKTFVDLLSVLEQNADISWEQLLDKVEVAEEKPSDMPMIDDGQDSTVGDDGLATFKL
ncbi:MAG: ATP-binding protein [Candidatus Sedimenticola sp. (ex Thyasira tokunagai)]